MRPGIAASRRLGPDALARTIQTPDDDTTEFLSSFGDGLHCLFITSVAELGAAGGAAFKSEAIDGLAIGVQRASGDKCDRCWHYTADVGANEEWPTICERCVANVRVIVEQEQA